MLTLLIVSFILSARSGHIYPHDIIIVPNTVGSSSEITFIFNLETPLAPTDYLRLILPFNLSSLQPAFWDTYLNCSTTGPTKRAIAAPSSVSSDTPYSFFVQFYTDLLGTTLSNLAANVDYFLKIIGTIETASFVGINKPVQMFSVSSNQGEWITYDSNRVFGTLDLATAFGSALKVSVSVPPTETSSNVPGASYKVNVDIVPNITITNSARVDIATTDPNFAILSCKSVMFNNNPNSTLNASFQSLSLNMIRASISQTFSAANLATYRFECLVRNPVAPATTPIIVTTRLGYAETIIESKTSDTQLQATPLSNNILGWDETSHKVLLGWGYEASAASALPIFSLYRDASQTETWYQSVKTVFKPKSDFITTEKLQVKVITVNENSFKILTASIFHNLPDYSPEDKVLCTQEAGTLICRNVGQLQAEPYFVSFRFNIPFGGQTTAAQDFGKVSVQIQADPTNDLLSLSATSLTNGVIATNKNLFTNNGANGVIASSVTSVGGLAKDYVTNGEDVILKFSFQYFTIDAVASPLTINEINRGIEFFTSNTLVSSVTPNCTIDTLVQNVDVILTDCGVDQMDDYTRLRFRLAKFMRTSGPPATLFSNPPQAGTILFNKVRFAADQFSSLNYVNENVFDYYAHWVQGFDAITPTTSTANLTQPFFFNSLVYKSEGLANVQVGTTFFITGASTTNDGASFPTLIRVSGFLSPNEQASADRLLLFFNDLEPLDMSNPCFGPTGIQCIYEPNALDNTQIDGLTDYSGSKRVEINIDLTQRFNIYIPVKTSPGKASIGFFLATASMVRDEGDLSNNNRQGIFASKFSKRIKQFTSTPTDLVIASPGTNTPMIDIPVGTPIGDILNTTIKNIQGNYVASVGSNVTTNVGTAYGYCANYDFTQQAGFSFQPFYNTTSTPDQLCVNIKYNPSTSKRITCQVCPVNIPMTNNTINLTSFQMPSLTGQVFFEGVYVIGSSNGLLQGAVLDQQASALAAFSLANVGLTFSPKDFKKESKNIYATLTFELSASLPNSVRINIIPAGPSTSLFMVPVSSIPCQVTTLTTTKCSASLVASNIQLDIDVAESAWPPAKYQIKFMVDASTAAAALSADTPVNYNVTISVNGISPFSSLHHISAPQTFIVNATANEGITLRNVTYLFGNKEAVTVVSLIFDLPSDMILYPQQSMIFSLNGISPSDNARLSTCLIREVATGNVSNSFLSCDVSNLAEVTIQPKEPVSGSFILEVGRVLVPTSEYSPITAKIRFVDASEFLVNNPSSGLPLPSTPNAQLIPSANLKLRRLYSNTGSIGELILSYRPSVSQISLTTNLYLYFPSYYPGRLGYRDPWCTANDLPVSCFIFDSWLLKLTAFPQTIAINQWVQIKIFGVMTPAIISIGKIFVGVGNGNDIYNLVEHQQIDDIPSYSKEPSPLSIDTFSLTNNKTREKTDFMFSFINPSGGITQNQVISIDFPVEYGTAFRGQQGPIVVISRTEDNTELARVQSTTFGSRLKIVMPSNLDPLTSYTFTIKDISNPDYPMCRIDRPTVSFMSTDETAATFRTAPNTWNALPMTCVVDPDLKTLNWVTANGELVKALTLTMGILSPEIRIVPPAGENFNNDIFFTPLQTSLTILPLMGTLQAVQGSPYLSLRIGAAVDSTPQIIPLGFNKTEKSDFNFYSWLPKIEVTLTNNKKTVSVGPIRIMRGGTSLPYMWKLDELDLIPQTELKIIATIENPTSSPLSILGASSLTFSLNRPKAGFNFILGNNADAQNPPLFDLSLGGIDQLNYQLETNKVQVVVLEPKDSAPLISELTVTSGSTPTRELFSLRSDQMAAIYWHVAFESNLTTTDCLRIRDKYEEGAQFDPTSANQEQYGAFFVYNETELYQEEIENLLANQVYSYTLCPFNQLDFLAPQINGTFKTADNQAASFELVVRFIRSVTRAQLELLVCLFTRELELPNDNVVAMDGTTCSVPSTFSSFLNFDYTRVSIFIEGNRRSDLNSTTRALLSQFISSINTQTPNRYLNEFDSMLENANLSDIFQSISLQAGPIYSIPVLDENSQITVSSTDTTILLSGLRLLSGPGIFYGIASNEDVTLPSQAQIRASMNSSNVQVVGSNVIFTNTSVTLVLSNLQPETDYTIYYYASTADRTQYARVTDVKYVQITTIPTRPVLNSGQRSTIHTIMLLVLTALLAF